MPPEADCTDGARGKLEGAWDGWTWGMKQTGFATQHVSAHLDRQIIEVLHAEAHHRAIDLVALRPLGSGNKLKTCLPALETQLLCLRNDFRPAMQGKGVYESLLILSATHHIAQNFSRLLIKDKCETYGLAIFHMKGRGNDLSIDITETVFIDLNLELNIGISSSRINHKDN